MKGALLTLAVLAAFGALLYFAVVAQAGFECEACVVAHGRTLCRSVRGESPQDAAQRAKQNACAILVSGVTDTLRCQKSQPVSVRCKEL